MDNLTTLYRYPKLLDIIYRECEDTGVTRVDKLERRVIKEIAGYVLKFPERAENTPLMFRRIKKHVHSYKSLYGAERALTFSSLVSEAEDGSEQDYEPYDALAGVEAEVMKKATINLLAQEDRRNRLILNEWASGHTVISDIARELALACGGNSETHRKKINRFRIECRETLVASVG